MGLVLPTAYSFNHDGTCLYFAAVSVFLARRLPIGLIAARARPDKTGNRAEASN